MKKVILMAALMLLAGAGMSQPPAGERGQRMSAEERQKMTEQNRLRRNDELRKALSLSDSLARKVDSVNSKYDLQVQELMKPENRDNGERSAMRTQMENIQKAREAEVKNLLTKEQQAKYDKWLGEQQQQQQQRRGRNRDGNRGGGGGGPR
jgi:K+-sensing histidine kinase KdpD